MAKVTDFNKHSSLVILINYCRKKLYDTALVVFVVLSESHISKCFGQEKKLFFV